MDLDILFESDCEISLCIRRSIGKISASIRDFTFKGLIQVAFRPLLSEIPIIGGIEVYFLTSPDIDFDLGGAANLLDMPGLRSKINDSIKG